MKVQKGSRSENTNGLLFLDPVERSFVVGARRLRQTNGVSKLQGMAGKAQTPK